jgi:hypothetical protein
MPASTNLIVSANVRPDDWLSIRLLGAIDVWDRA